MKILTDADVNAWMRNGGMIEGFKRAEELARMERTNLDPDTEAAAGEYSFLDGPARHLGAGPMLAAALEEMVHSHGEATDQQLKSIPFYSLCKGLFLPLSGLDQSRVEFHFGLRWPHEPLSREERTEVVRDFFQRNVGLSLYDKVCAVMGDPFAGKKAWMGRDSVLDTLATVELIAPDRLTTQLPRFGELGLLAASLTDAHRSDPPLNTAEVFYALRHLKALKSNQRREVVREMMSRAGKLERYFICALILRKTHLKYQFNQQALMELLASYFHVPLENVATACAILDVFETTRILETEGADGLRRVHLRPLQPLAPMLAGGTLPAPGQSPQAATAVELSGKFPLWCEKKYDGMRLVLHKTTDAMGTVLTAAFTRNRQDWTEWVPGIKHIAQALPCQSCIIDGELHGMVLDADPSAAPRRADVYEVYQFLRGDSSSPVRLRYTVFDLIFLNGQETVKLPLSRRRELLSMLVNGVGPRGEMLPIPLELAEGQLVSTISELNQLHEFFRRQGYEGTMAKQPASPYVLGTRAPEWLKRKPVVTLEFAITGVFFAIEHNAFRAINPILISALDEQQRLVPVGTVGGLSGEESNALVQMVISNGLLTGRKMDHSSASGTHPGMEIRPFLVVTVKFEAVVEANENMELINGEPLQTKHTLRSPQLVHIRGNEKEVQEVATLADLAALHLRQRVS